MRIYVTAISETANLQRNYELESEVLPRIGERVLLPDGYVGTVENVTHNFSSVQRTPVSLLVVLA